MSFAKARLRGRTHRLIASRFPTVGVFDDIAANEDELRAAFILEDLTNVRSHARLDILPEGGVAIGPTAYLAMAAFLHCSEEGGRFTGGDLGAWYASTDLETAMAETVFHHERRLKMSAGGFPARIQMRELTARLRTQLLDIRGARQSHPELYDPKDYSGSQAFARGLRWPLADPGEDGLVFDSVRRAGGTNVCIFRPTALELPIVQADHYEYVWNSTGVLTIVKLTRIDQR